MEPTKRQPIGDKITHYAQLKNGEYIGHWDLPEDKSTQKVVIDSIAFEEVYNQQTMKKEKKSVLAFRGAQKRLILNATNMKSIASKHGDNPKGWIGKEVELYRSTTKVAGIPQECVRVKADGSKVAKDKANSAAEAAQ